MNEIISQLIESWAEHWSFNVTIETIADENGITAEQAEILLKAGFELRKLTK